MPTSCGGFWPASESSFENSFRSLCVCNEPWFHHEALRNDSAANPLPPLPPPPGPPPAPAPPLNPLRASLPTPISTFTGPLSGAGTANENRNAAIVRHFPKPKRYKAPHAFPLTAPSASTFPVLIALWPNLPGSPADDGSPTIDFAFTIDQFTEMLITLKACGLAFLATLPSGDQSDIVQELSSQLNTQLAAHNLILPNAAGSSNDSTTLCRRKTVYVFAQHAKANANNFNKKLIIEIDSKFINPDIEHRGIPLLNLGVRYGPVKGSLPHTLSPEALVDAVQLDQLHSWPTGQEYNAQCLDGLCPDESISPGLIAAPISPPVVHPRPQSVSCANSYSQPIEVLSSDDEFIIPQPILPPRHIPLPRRFLHLYTTSLDVASVPEGATVRIKGHDIKAIAEFIIGLFLHWRQLELDLSSSFPRPSNIVEPRVEMTHYSFLQSQAYRIYLIGQEGLTSLGCGVEQSVWRHILESIAKENQFWRPSTVEADHATFILSPVSTPVHAAQFHVHGQLIAIHMYYYGHGLSIGLWPVLALALGRQSMLLGVDFLQLISPDVAAELRSWFTLRPEDPIPTSLAHPVCTLIMETLDIQPSLIPSVRTSDQHDNLTVKLMSRKVLGYDSDTLWTSPDFVSASSGFDMRLSQEHSFCHAFRTAHPLKAACLIAGMYHRQVQNLPVDVLPHLHFAALGYPNVPPVLTNLTLLFEMRLKRYLAGRGHPQWFRDHGLLLLLTALESLLLPIKDNWAIRFTISSLLDGVQSSEALPLGFHTCSGGVDVRVNRKLMALMMESPHGEEDTDFDVWAHTQLYNADSTYNMI
ncbi:hypothetical protein B0H16DRAFT_1721032 [Mycena metata]|uniref:Uncharacterized protein n=1 Tax=Mycena metata TaxID=1033252 RepID=A0AAD7NF01_9AGAR|nr:hypothetical protein B0H16DRAFT_1721032 [Mycena metata]